MLQPKYVHLKCERKRWYQFWLLVFFCWNISFIYIELVNKQNHSKNAHVGVRKEGDRETIKRRKKAESVKRSKNPLKIFSSTVAICITYYSYNMLFTSWLFFYCKCLILDPIRCIFPFALLLLLYSFRSYIYI